MKNNKTNRGKGGKPNQRANHRRRMVEESIPESDINQADLPKNNLADKSNDPSWYMQNAQLAIDSGNLSYSYVLGLNLINDLKLDVVNQQGGAIPGVCALYFAPTIGHSVDSTSAVNRATLMLWAYIRSKISGSRRYDPIDVMMYDIAVDSAYMWWTTLCRLYGVMTNFSVANRYTPRTLVEAMGFNYDNLILDLPALRAQINLFAKQMGALCVPAGMSYNTRHAWMCANVFTDAESAKAQYYLFAPGYYYVFNEATSGPGFLQITALPPMNGISMTLSHIRDICNEIIEPLLGSEDIGSIAGDVLNAFGSGSLLQTAQIDDTFTVNPVYSKEVLSQIENLEISCNLEISSITQDVSATANCLVQTIQAPTWMNQYTGRQGLYADNAHIITPHILNLHGPADPGMNFVATRGMIGTTNSTSTGDNNQPETAKWMVDAFGSEVFVQGRIYRNIDWQGDYYPDHVWKWCTCMFSAEGIEADDLAALVKDWVAFDWAPKLFTWDAGQIPGTGESVELIHGMPMLDYDNVTTVSNDTLKRMHEVAMLSLFSVTNVGEYER